MNDIFVLDNGASASLIQSGGRVLLDAFSQYNKIIIPLDIRNEMFPGTDYTKPDSELRANQVILRDWIKAGEASGRIEIGQVTVDKNDVDFVRRFLPGHQAGANVDVGDLAIMELVAQRAGDGNTYHIATDNFRDFANLPGRLDALGLDADVSITTNSYELLAQMYLSGQISRTQYTTYTSTLANGPRKGQVNASAFDANGVEYSRILPTQELDSFEARIATDGYMSVGKAAVIAAAAEALRHAGFVGDAISLLDTTDRANALIAAGDIAGAEQEWARFGGDLTGGFAGALGAVGTAALLFPELGSSIGGGVILVGVGLVGGHFGSEIGKDFAEYAVAQAQQSLANGDALVMDDVVAMWGAFAAERGLNPALDGAGVHVPIGSISSVRLPGQFGEIELGSELNMLDYLAKMKASSAYCFLAGTMIDMWPLDPAFTPNADGLYDEAALQAKIWRKPIEEIRPEDVVVSVDENGNKKPGRVSRTMQNTATHILDFHGVYVTPGHAYYCAEGAFAGRYAPLIDILRSDGAVQRSDGVKIRAATNCEVGSEDDRLIWAIAGKRQGAYVRVSEKGQIRLGAKHVTPDGRVISVHDIIRENGWFITHDGALKLRPEDRAGTLFHWPFGDKLPKPEDYVLALSAVTLEELYSVPWESPHAPQLPPPYRGEAGNAYMPSRTPMHAAPNIPLSLRGADAPKPAMSRQQRRAVEARKRKAAKRMRGKATIH